jgi:cysteine desulfurase
VDGRLENYFDYNATSPLLPAARQALVDALDDGFGNPSSLHWAGRRARRLVEEAREAVAALVGVAPGEVVFTGGATESLTQAVYSAGPGRVVMTALEHPALPAALRALGAREAAVVPCRLASPPAGPLDAAALEAAVLAEAARSDAPTAGPVSLISLMGAHNVTGLLLPAAALAQRLADAGVQAPMLVDAAQLAGRLPLQAFTGAARPAFMVLAAHKLGGPKGIGALIHRQDAPVRALFPGGGQEGGRRGGTENVPLVAAFGAAARYLLEHGASLSARLSALRDAFEARLGSAVAVIGRDAARLPQTSALIVPAGLDGETVVRAMHKRGFAISAGSACASGSPLPAPGLLSLGLTADEALRMIRVSFGFTNNDISALGLADALLAAFAEAEGGRP